MTPSPLMSEQYVPLAETISKLVKLARCNDILIELLIDLARVDASFNAWVFYDLKGRDSSDKIEEALDFYSDFVNKASIIEKKFSRDSNVDVCTSDLSALTQSLRLFR